MAVSGVDRAGASRHARPAIGRGRGGGLPCRSTPPATAIRSFSGTAAWRSRIHFLGWRVIWRRDGPRLARSGQGQRGLLRRRPGERRRRSDAASAGRRAVAAVTRARSRVSAAAAASPTSPAMYNTQSQFFDQTIRDWRWTADPELEKILRPALELHLEWAQGLLRPGRRRALRELHQHPADRLGLVQRRRQRGGIGLRLLRPPGGDGHGPAGRRRRGAARHQARAEKIQPRPARSAVAEGPGALRPVRRAGRASARALRMPGSTASFCRSTPG